MTPSGAKTPFVAIACGGTGGHLFPGLAVAGELKQRGCRTALLISPKDIDQQAVKSAPANGNLHASGGRPAKSELFFLRRQLREIAVCARGKFFAGAQPRRGPGDGRVHQRPAGFGGERYGSKDFLARVQYHSRPREPISRSFHRRGVRRISSAAARLTTRESRTTGTPVRPQFQPRDDAVRAATPPVRPLYPHCPTILVMGGSQGASGINEFILPPGRCSPARHSTWQWLHLTGTAQFERVKTRLC